MPKFSPPSTPWLRLGVLGSIALGLRLWGLGRWQKLVFDEVYYVPFALGYLTQTPNFDVHPPLGKYLIALGIGLGQWPARWWGWPTIEVEGVALSPLSFRLMNALVGATLPLVVAGLAYALSACYPTIRRWRFATVAAALMVMEGLTLVESRLGLINLYWLWFGLVGQWGWLMANALETCGSSLASTTLEGEPDSADPQVRPWHWISRLLRSPLTQPTLWRLVAGIALGAAANVKWNGAGFWLGLVLWQGMQWGIPWRNWMQPRMIPKKAIASIPPAADRHPQDNFRPDENVHRRWLAGMIYLGIVPLVTYALLWLPHLALTGETWLGVHQQLWQAHQTMASGGDAHPYCSAWYTWPLMLRPIAYFHEAAGWPEFPAMMAPYRPYGNPIYTIQAMGNPVLWWVGTAGVLALGLSWVSQGVKGHRRLSLTFDPSPHPREITPSTSPVASFVVVNYLANWLPWMVVSRCAFLYHALGMAAFSTLAIAWLLSRWWGDRRRDHRAFAWGLLALIALSFWFWLPLFLGLPLSPTQLERRWWLPTWI